MAAVEVRQNGSTNRKLEICCVGFGGELMLKKHESKIRNERPTLIPSVVYTAIGTIYSLALERSGKANVTAVCR